MMGGGMYGKPMKKGKMMMGGMMPKRKATAKKR